MKVGNFGNGETIPGRFMIEKPAAQNTNLLSGTYQVGSVEVKLVQDLLSQAFNCLIRIVVFVLTGCYCIPRLLRGMNEQCQKTLYNN